MQILSSSGASLVPNPSTQKQYWFLLASPYVGGGFITLQKLWLNMLVMFCANMLSSDHKWQHFKVMDDQIVFEVGVTFHCPPFNTEVLQAPS